MAKNFFSKLNFTQFLDEIVGRKLIVFTICLVDVASLEDAQLIFLIFHSFVCKIWLRRRTSGRSSR